MRVLVTGATGYIGGRLIPRLLEAGMTVRIFARDRRRVAWRPWAGAVEVVEGDMLDDPSVARALQEVDVAFYLVHSMRATRHFESTDRRAAEIFLRSASEHTRIIYLGGLLPEGGRSSHLRSRGEVGEILRRHENTLELRAGPIIGAGSASFEMVRYLTERLPAMIAPRWIDNAVQPIAVDDVLSYLLQAARNTSRGVVDIGGTRLTFRAMMQGYARVRGLRRIIVRVPVLTPRLAGLWIGLVTPIPNRLALPIVEGILSPVVADLERARDEFPSINPLGYEQAVERAVEQLKRLEIETSWSGAMNGSPGVELSDKEGLVREARTIDVKASPSIVFETVASIGGAKGWKVWRWAWWVRGALDRLAGGPGLRRGRRHPLHLYPGEALDFWRVESVIPNELLRLRAEMRVPGRAWLQWEIAPHGDGASRLVQTALFAPRGLFGVLYWYLLYPIHGRIFSDLARALAREAEQTQSASLGNPS